MKDAEKVVALRTMLQQVNSNLEVVHMAYAQEHDPRDCDTCELLRAANNLVVVTAGKVA